MMASIFLACFFGSIPTWGCGSSAAIFRKFADYLLKLIFYKGGLNRLTELVFSPYCIIIFSVPKKNEILFFNFSMILVCLIALIRLFSLLYMIETTIICYMQNFFEACLDFEV